MNKTSGKPVINTRERALHGPYKAECIIHGPQSICILDGIAQKSPLGSYSVTNAGDETLTNAEIILIFHAGQAAFRQLYPANINPGQTGQFFLDTIDSFSSEKIRVRELKWIISFDQASSIFMTTIHYQQFIQ